MPTRVYRTFEDWQAAQELDTRTPEQRGIKIGGHPDDSSE